MINSFIIGYRHSIFDRTDVENLCDLTYVKQLNISLIGSRYMMSNYTGIKSIRAGGL